MERNLKPTFVISIQSSLVTRYGSFDVRDDYFISAVVSWLFSFQWPPLYSDRGPVILGWASKPRFSWSTPTRDEMEPDGAVLSTCTLYSLRLCRGRQFGSRSGLWDGGGFLDVFNDGVSLFLFSLLPMPSQSPRGAHFPLLIPISSIP